MANYEDYESDVSYKPYLFDDGKHYLSARERTTNYWQAFYAASSTRFGVIPDSVEEEKAAAAADVAPVEVAPKKSYKKNYAGLVFNLIFVVAFIALCALSYFAVLKDYTYFFAGAGSKELFDVILNADTSAMEIGDIIMTYAVPGTAVLAAALAVISFILVIIALAVKGKVNAMGALGLIAFISWLACGILMFFAAGVAQDADSIIAYINPLEETGVQFGYYIGAALLLLAMICGFCCYRKKKN